MSLEQPPQTGNGHEDALPEPHEVAPDVASVPPPLPTRRARRADSSAQPVRENRPGTQIGEHTIGQGASPQRVPGSHARIIIERAIETARRGDRATAHSMFEYVATLQPSNPNVWVWIGGTSASPDGAEEAFQRARELDPSNEKAALGLRWVALRRQAEGGTQASPLPVRPAQSVRATRETQPEVEAAPQRGIFSGITRNVFVLGAVSFFTDIGTEMLVPVRILFLVTALQTPLAIAGLIEGIAAATGSLLSVVSGRLSDATGRRKPLLLLGYSLSSVARPLLFFAGNWAAALGLIFLDRTGKGIRGSPRDAIIADSTPRRHRGKAFGFHRSMDTMGAAIGPLFTYAILLLTNDDLRAVFAWTALPGLLAVLVLMLFLRERRGVRQAEASPPAMMPAPILRVSARSLGRRFWMFTALSTVFALGNSSDAFIFLRAADLTDSLLMVPLIYFGFNVVYAVLAGPLGAWSDRFGRLPLLISGYAAFALVYLGWAIAVDGWAAWALFLLYGVYAAATEGVARAFVVDLVPREARASALGWFPGLVGLAALPANIIAGWLWSMLGPSATFTYGAWLAAVAVALSLAWLPWLRSSKDPENVYATVDENRDLGNAQA